MLNLNLDVEEKLSPAIEGRWVEINPKEERRICIKKDNNIIAAIDIPDDINIRTVEILFTNTEHNSIADREVLMIEADCMIDEYNYYAKLTGFITTKYNDNVHIKIREIMFSEEGGIEIVVS